MGVSSMPPWMIRFFPYVRRVATGLQSAAISNGRRPVTPASSQSGIRTSLFPSLSMMMWAVGALHLEREAPLFVGVEVLRQRGARGQSFALPPFSGGLPRPRGQEECPIHRPKSTCRIESFT